MSLLTASVGAGMAAGFSKAGQYERERPIRELQLEQARLQQERAQAEFSEWQGQADTRQAESEQRLAQAEQGAYEAQTSLFRQQTYDAFGKYDADGDTRHLNTFLADAKRSPVGGSIYANYSRIDPISSLSTEEARTLFRQAGYDSPDYFLSDPKLGSQFVVATGNDGSLSLVDMDKLKVSTRYDQYMTNQQLAQMKERATIDNLLRGFQSNETIFIRDMAKSLREENEDMSEGDALKEALRIYKESDSASKGTAVERLARFLMTKNPDLEFDEASKEATLLLNSGTEAEREGWRNYGYGGLPGSSSGAAGEEADAINPIFARRERTSTQQNADAATSTRSELDKAAGGSFFELDLSDQKNRRKVGPLVNRLQQLSGQSFSNEDQRVARQIRELTMLGGTAGEELTTAQTGILDSLLGTVKKYVSDSGGTRGVAAYETFRNTIRNSLYGASLTSSEIAAFNKAAGTLGQQLGPVMRQLQVQVETLRSQLSSMYDMNDEYVSYYYLGKDRDDLDRVIEALEQRIDLLNTQADKSRADAKVPAKSRVAPPPEQTTSKRTPEENRRLMEERRARGS